MSIYIDGEVVTKKRLFELLTIAPGSIPMARDKRFKFPVKVDSDGNRRHLGRLLCNEYSVYVPSLNREVRVRWALSQKKDKDGNLEYFPTDNEMKAGEGGEVLVNDEMIYLFWYINPMNRQSPFKKPQSAVFYEYLDNDHLAKVSNSIDETRISAMSIVLGSNAWSISRLRTLAKGMGIAGVNDMTDEVVKSTLKGRAYKDPEKFIMQAESREIAFTGKIQEAIDRNIIQLRTVNGMQRWYIGQNEIIPVQYGIDARKILDDHLSSKWYMYSDEINQLLEGSSVSTNLSKPENDSHFEDSGMVGSLVEADTDVWREYLALKRDEFKFQKIKRFSEIDPTDPNINGNQRKAVIAHKRQIEIYKAGVAMENDGN